jgi:ribosomal protein S11
MEGKSVYRCVKSLVRVNNSDNRWSERSLNDEPVATLFNVYREVLLVLTHTSHSDLVTLNLKDVVTMLSGIDDTITVSQWLTSLGNQSLPTTPGGPVIESKTVKYRDAFKAGYKGELVFSEGNPFNDVPDSDKDDILLTKKGVDYATFHKNCLVTVNGMVHRTDYDHNGIYVKDGGISFRKANENHIGILNFKEVGSLDFISITEDMLYNPHQNGEFKNAVYLKLPKSIGNKIVMVVLGGYLHLIDSYYHCINEHAIKLDFANLPLLPRFYESRKLIDLSAMEKHHEKSSNNDTHVVLSDLLKNESISAYLTLSQSFVVLVDCDNLYLEKHKLGYSHLPGRYFSSQEPVWPARTELGRLPEYVAIPESSIWTIAVQDNFSTRYMYESFGYESGVTVDGARVSRDPVFYAQGHLLEIGTDKLVYSTAA